MLHPGYKQQFFLCVLCASARKQLVKPPASATVDTAGSQAFQPAIKFLLVLRLAQQEAIVVVTTHAYKVFWLISQMINLLTQVKRHDLILRTVQHKHRVIHALDVLRNIEVITHHNQAGQNPEYRPGKIPGRTQG